MFMSDKFVPYIRQVLQEMPPKFDPPTDGYLRSLGHDTSKIRPMGLNECLFPPSPKVLAAITNALGMITRYPDAQAQLNVWKMREWTMATSVCSRATRMVGQALHVTVS